MRLESVQWTAVSCGQMPKKPPMVQIWAKVPTAWKDDLQKEADAEGIDLSDVVRRAVRAHLHGGAEKLAVVLREERATYAAVNPFVERAGAWLDGLPDDVRAFTVFVGESLESQRGNQSLSQAAAQSLSRMATGTRGGHGKARKPR